MFWNTHKKRLQDRELGLVFNWRNVFSLKYPLLFFLLLSLLAHFFFLRLFQFPEPSLTTDFSHQGTLYLMGRDNSREMARLYSKIVRQGVQPSRGQAIMDPLVRGVEEQLGYEISGGLFDWNAPPHTQKPIHSLKESPLMLSQEKDFLFAPPTDLFLEKALPHVDVEQEKEGIHVQLSQALKDRLLPYRPTWPDLDSLDKLKEEFFLSLSPEGQITLLITENGSKMDSPHAPSSQKALRWIKSLKWAPSATETQGTIRIEGNHAIYD